MSNPFGVLGIEPTTDRERIRTAWRALAKINHPDVGGSQERMKRLNTAFREALAYVDTHQSADSFESLQNQRREKPKTSTWARSFRVRQDVSSFTIDTLPVDSFELLRIAGSILGQVSDSDCPYMIEFTLEDLEDTQVGTAWCRCDLVPEAGGTMVHLTIGATNTSIETVRDAIVECVNEIQV